MSGSRGAGLRLFALPVLLALLTAVFVACEVDEDDGDPAEGTAPLDQAEGVEAEPAPIDGIELVTSESDPPQYAVDISAGLPTQCHEFLGYEDERSGNTIDITVENRIPSTPEAGVECAEVYTTNEFTVDLPGEFESGETYTVNVNDESIEFTAE